MTFNYYISGSGTSTGTGTLASPFDISVLSGSPDQHTRSYFQTLFAGKRIGFVGTVPVYSTYAAVLSIAGNGNYGAALGIPGGTQASPTYYGCSNSSGYEVERSCTLDGHQDATVGESSVTPGVLALISSITTGNPTVITLNSSAASNPFASLVGKQVAFSSISGSDFSAIGLTPIQGSSGGSLYTISAVSASSPWTVTISATTTGTYTPATNPAIEWNYPVVIADMVGQPKNAPFTSSYGWWTIKGVNMTGMQTVGIGTSSPTSQYCGSANSQDGGPWQISAISTGASTTVTINSTVAANPFSTGCLIEMDGVTGISGLNYASGAGTFTVSAVGGSAGAWTATISVATSGSLTSTTAYIESKVPGITVEDCDIYDLVGDPSTEPAAVYTEQTKGLLVQNDKLHDIDENYQSAAGLDGSGWEGFYDDDYLIQDVTVYNSHVGFWEKSYPQAGGVIRDDFVQTLPQAGLDSVGIFEGVGQVITGLSQNIYNNIIISAQCLAWEWTDSQTPFAGSEDFHNNTCYEPSNLGSASIEGIEMVAGASTGGLATLTPQPSALNYNNIFNQLAGGSTLYNSGYVTGAANGTSSAPTSINLSISNYNSYDVSSGTSALNLSGYTLPLVVGQLGTYTLSAWQTATGLDGGSVLGSPTYASANLGYQYPTSNFQLASGSVGKGAGHVGGTSGGAATDMGAWGGSPAPTQIGSSF